MSNYNSILYFAFLKKYHFTSHPQADKKAINCKTTSNATAAISAKRT